MSYPGNLEWVPAHERTDLLALPVAEAISGYACAVAAIDPDLADTAAFCEAYAVMPEESANCVIVEGRRGGMSKLAAVMVLAPDRADINRTVRLHLGLRKISFASRERATELTGMEFGGITPLGLPSGWPVLVDSRVGQAGWIVIGSGIRGSKLAIQGRDLLHLPEAEQLELTL